MAEFRTNAHLTRRSAASMKRLDVASLETSYKPPPKVVYWTDFYALLLHSYLLLISTNKVSKIGLQCKPISNRSHQNYPMVTAPYNSDKYTCLHYCFIHIFPWLAPIKWVKLVCNVNRFLTNLTRIILWYLHLTTPINRHVAPFISPFN